MSEPESSSTVSATKTCPNCGQAKSPQQKGSLTSWLFQRQGCNCSKEVIAAAAQTMILSELSGAEQWSLASPHDPIEAPQSASSGSDPAAPLATVDLGEQYQVLEVIGAGGMGTVFKVRDKYLQQEFAAKVLHPHLVVDQAAARRFAREIEFATHLHSSYIVVTHAAGITPDGRPFAIMDFLNGHDLSSQGVIAPARAMRIFIQICKALEYAHHKGIVHRDLKPGNIFLLDGPEGRDQVKVIDFGIAKVTLAGGAATTALTQTGELIGTPLYMSPEQCTGGEVTQSCDIYSLGCIMYECLTGHNPFADENVVKIILRHLKDERPPSLSRFMPADVLAPSGLQQVIRTCLQVNPGRRYQTMRSLRQDLERIVAGKNPLCHAGEQKRWLNSKVPMLPAVFLMVLLIAVIVALATRKNIPSASLPAGAGVVTKAPVTACGLAVSKVSAPKPGNSAAPAAVPSNAKLALPARQIPKPVPQDLVDAAERMSVTQLVQAATFSSMPQHSKPDPQTACYLYEEALKRARESDPPDRLGEILVLKRYGFDLMSFKRDDQAEKLFREGLEIAEALGNKRDQADFLSALGTVCGDLGRPAEAVQNGERAIALYNQVRPDQSGMLPAYYDLASHLYFSGSQSYGKALQYFAKVHELQRRYPTDNGAVLNGFAYHYEGMIADNQGRYADAIKLLKLAQPAFLKNPGPNRAFLEGEYQDISRHYRLVKDQVNAEAYKKKADDIEAAVRNTSNTHETGDTHDTGDTGDTGDTHDTHDTHDK